MTNESTDKPIRKPPPRRSLLAVLATFSPIEEKFPAIRDLPADPVDL